MPRARLLWLQIAEQQYRDVAPDIRQSVDRRIARLVENPTADRDAVHNSTSDQWSVALGEQGFLYYAVVRDPPAVIVLRIVGID